MLVLLIQWDWSLILLKVQRICQAEKKPVCEKITDKALYVEIC